MPTEKEPVALFGGAFDPITLGHEITMQAIHAVTGFNVWVMPCYGHRFDKQLALSHHRLNMCGDVTRKYGWATTSDFEVGIRHNGSTYELLNRLKVTFPEIQFHLAIGTDNFLVMEEKWDRGKQLMEENPLIIIGRQGYDIDPVRVKPPHQFIDLRFPGGSSTLIRRWVAEGKYDVARRNVDSQVWKHIGINFLYGYEDAHA